MPEPHIGSDLYISNEIDIASSIMSTICFSALSTMSPGTPRRMWISQRFVLDSNNSTVHVDQGHVYGPQIDDRRGEE